MESPPLGWIALLPAAKTTTPGGDGAPWRDVLSEDRHLRAARRKVATSLRRAARDMDGQAWERLVDGQGEAAGQARRDAKAVLRQPTLPAGRRFAGPVAARFDAETLPDAGARHVAFVDAVAGIARAGDGIPAMRLPIAARLDDLGVLSTFWRVPLTRWLEANLTDDGVIFDLLGGEYQRALVAPEGRTHVEVRFTQPDGRAAPSATAKQLRGLAARHLASDPTAPRSPAGAFAGFDVEVAGTRWQGPGALDGGTLVLPAS